MVQLNPATYIPLFTKFHTCQVVGRISEPSTAMALHMSGGLISHPSPQGVGLHQWRSQWSQGKKA